MNHDRLTDGKFRPSSVDTVTPTSPLFATTLRLIGGPGSGVPDAKSAGGS